MQPFQQKLIAQGALIALAGYILSGPVGVGAVLLFHPQPAWTDARTFVEHYHLIQTLPYFFGFLLIGGMLALVAGHYLEDGMRHKNLRLLALCSTTAFVALIFLNYIIQTTFVHNMAWHYRPEFDPAIAAFSMANPLSLSWGIEMWGYGLLGVATWLLAPVYRDRNNTIRWLLIANGWMSLGSALLTVAHAYWIMTQAGFAAYLLWNAVMIALMILIYRHARIN